MTNKPSLVCTPWIAAAVCCCHAGGLGAEESDPDASIRKVRMGTLVIETAPGDEVRVEQLRHEFWFGVALASQMFSGRAGGEDADKCKNVFLENFNAAVTENALKRHSTEQTKGEVDYSIVDEILAWARGSPGFPKSLRCEKAGGTNRIRGTDHA